MTTSREPASPPVLEDFEYLSLLGSGGYADVYLYQQLRPRREVAVKVLLAEGLTTEGRRQFAAEADLMASLSAHPSIVTIYDADIAADGRPYLVMEYYPGPNLGVRAKNERIPVPDVLRIGVQIAAAVETAHRAGILHRDLKPANILTSRYQKPGLTDFGISASTQDRSEDAGALSVPWAPPEAFGSEVLLDPRSDVYSLGATLYTLLAGRSPFQRADAPNRYLDLMARIERDPVPPTGRDDVPVALERLLAHTMAKSPESRPAAALDLARSLQQIEIDLRLQPTAIDVLGDLRAPSSRAVGDEADATRVRGVVTIDPQPQSTPASGGPSGTPEHAPPVPERPLAAPPGPAASPRPAAPPVIVSGRTPDEATRRSDRQVAVGETVRRADATPAPQAGTGGAPAPAPTASVRAPRRWLVVAALVAGVVVVGGLLLAARGGGGAVATGPTTSPGDPAPTSLLQDRPPAPTGITLRRDGNAVSVRWTNPDPQPDDRYVWWRTDVSGTPRETQAMSASIGDVPVGASPCVVVLTVRGGVSSLEPDRPSCLQAGG